MTGKTAECPNCRLIAKERDIEKKFGWRISNNKKILQSWCRNCRSGQQTFEEDQKIDKNLFSKIKNYAKELKNKTTVSDLFTKPDGLNFQYSGEKLSTADWSKESLKIVNKFDIAPIIIAENKGFDIIYFEPLSMRWNKP